MTFDAVINTRLNIVNRIGCAANIDLQRVAKTEKNSAVAKIGNLARARGGKKWGGVCSVLCPFP